MPFLGQDWRSPGWSWIKTEDGWKRCESWSQELERDNNQRNLDHSVILNSEDEEIFSNEEHGYASKKRKKGHFRNDTNNQCFYREKWIYVHKESTRERHGYCTLGEAFNRLDFSSAIQDVRRFNYVVKLLQLIAKSQLTSLSGVAQKNYFNILDKIVQKVLHDQQNPRLIKGLLHDLGSTLCVLIRGVGKSVLVGNINVWVCRLETVLAWQQQLQNLQMPQARRLEDTRRVLAVETWAQWPGHVCPTCRLALTWLVRMLAPPQPVSSGGAWSVVAAVGSVLGFPREESARLGAAGRACT